MHYEICWVGSDGIYGCGHEHPSIADAVMNMVPGSASFIRAVDSGVFRSLNETEVGHFLVALKELPWSSARMNKEEKVSGG